MQNRPILLELKYFIISSLLIPPNIPPNSFYNYNLYLLITDEPSMDKVSVLILNNYVFKMDDSSTVHDFFYFKINL